MWHMQVSMKIIWSFMLPDPELKILTITPLEHGRKTVPGGFKEDLATHLRKKCLAMAFSFGGNEK